MFIENEELFFVDYDNDVSKKIIYAPLRSYLALISEDTMNSLLSTEHSEVKNIVLKRIKDRPQIDIRNILDGIHKATPYLTIAITDNCNLRCVYCHAAAGESHKQKSMDQNMIHTVIKSFFETINTDQKEVKIQFTGGEPTYNFDNFRFAVFTAKDYALKNEIRLLRRIWLSVV